MPKSNLGLKQSLFIPGEGEHSFAERDSIPVPRDEMVTFSKLQALHNKYKIILFCQLCERSIDGFANNDSSSVLRVRCGCREWVFVP